MCCRRFFFLLFWANVVHKNKNGTVAAATREIPSSKNVDIKKGFFFTIFSRYVINVSIKLIMQPNILFENHMLESIVRMNLSIK